MVLASEGDSVCSDRARYCTSLINDGAGITFGYFSSLGVDAPSVPGECRRRVVDPEGGEKDGDNGGDDDGDNDDFGPRMASLNFGSNFSRAANGFESCCGGGASDKGDGGVVPLLVGRLLF